MSNLSKTSVSTTKHIPPEVPFPPKIFSPEKVFPTPSITIHLDMDHVVFLVTDILNLPKLDAQPTEKREIRLRVLPGLLLDSPKRQTICPLLLRQSSIPIQAQILSVAHEQEDPFYGFSMFAKLTTAPDYTNRIPEKIFAHLPCDLAYDLFPEQIASHPDIQNLPTPACTAEEMNRAAKLPVCVNFELPTGHRLPELRPNKIARVSLNLYTHTGGLIPSGTAPLLINSRSCPTRIHNAPLGFNPPSDDYYQLYGTSFTLPVTSDLPKVYEDYTDSFYPHAAAIARANT